ncbi:MAG TPA: dipeptide ABC transporter ATP-binding protein [Steroidobacteraceae bacterium]|jgi:oligopeptide/dipeptide ABC transporter ATP-binding protein
MNGSEPILSLHDVHVDFATPSGTVEAVRGLSLEVNPGECLGVVGESGAGKSQAFLAAMGLLAANGSVRGRATFGSMSLLDQPPEALDKIRGLKIGMVFQDPMTSLTPHVVVGDQIAEPMVVHIGMPWREARLRALALLRLVRVNDPERRLNQYPHELSGGMRQRVMIAIALACQPLLLIADEPTTALDVTVQAQILALLADLKRERAMSMVLITHDLGVIAGLADRVVVMRGGRIVEENTVGGLFSAPREAYTQELLAAMPRLDEPPLPPVDGPNAASMAAVARPDHPGERRPQQGPPPLEVASVSVSFPVREGVFGSRTNLVAVDDVSLRLLPGEAVGLVGESGSGKSTLARVALQLIRPSTGRVVWMGRPVEGVSEHRLKSLRRDIQIVFQDPLASLDPRMRISRIIVEPLRAHRRELDRAGREQAVFEALAHVGLEPEIANRYPHELSGGQCQRVGIARAMVLKPRVLVCDEPVSALDVSVQAQVVNLLGSLKREHGISMLFVSHNLAVVKRLCERVMVMYLGRMMELATAESLYGKPRHPYTRSLLDAVPVADPEVQPGRFARSVLGEPPSPLSPPSGCVYRTRCPYAAEICRDRRPAWEATAEGGFVACHRWREI